MAMRSISSFFMRASSRSPLLITLHLLLGTIIITPSPSEGRKPLVYLYGEDPAIFNDHNTDMPARCDNVNHLYAADVCLYELLKASPYVTKDPSAADYFYLPVYLFWHNKQLSQDHDRLIKHLRKQGPWFDRRNGSDHIFIWTWDFGRCEFPLWSGPLNNSILIHHYGRVINGNLPGPKGNPCNLMKHWGGNCDPMMDLMAMKAKGETIGHDWTRVSDRPHGLKSSWYEPCHYINHDIIVPPSIWEDTSDTPFLSGGKHNLERTGLLFFAGANDNKKAGDPWHDAYYSGGVRQIVSQLFTGRNHSRLATGHLKREEYIRELNTHKFCLAPAGWGWGARVKVSIMHGCVPVIIQDFIRVEWEETLPLIKYAIRIPLWLVHRLESILLHYVESGEWAKMRKAIECTWRLHRWSQPEGRAFEVLMCELRRRLVGGEIELDTETCTIKCGGGAKGKAVSIHDQHFVDSIGK